METGLVGKSVFVTGAGSGIGRAAALIFAAEKARVVISDLNAERVHSVVTEIQASGGQAMAAVGDISDPAVVKDLVAKVISAYGGVDVLVNNAGIMDSMGANDEVALEEWDRVLRINLTAPFLLSREVIPLMLAKGKGAIVNTTSEAGLRGSAAGAAYTASKHGLIGLTKSSAVMYRKRGIRVNAVAPGGTKTNIQVNQVAEWQGPATVGAYMGNLGKFAEAQEVGNVIVFLASDLASDINGAILPVDDGWSAI
jgi:NAD(P)-dependent dehydrogenase (short-subunit alcohol dehydrogenase family)